MTVDENIYCTIKKQRIYTSQRTVSHCRFLLHVFFLHVLFERSLFLSLNALLDSLFELPLLAPDFLQLCLPLGLQVWILQQFPLMTIWTRTVQTRHLSLYGRLIVFNANKCRLKQGLLAFPSRIICFLLLISFFSSKSVHSSFYNTRTSVFVLVLRDVWSHTPTTKVTLNMKRRTRTISHWRLVTLTWVRIFRTSASFTGYSFNLVSAVDKYKLKPTWCSVWVFLKRC